MRAILILLLIFVTSETYARHEKVGCIGEGIDIVVIQDSEEERPTFPGMDTYYRGFVEGVLDGREIEYLPVSVKETYTGREFNFKIETIWHGHFNYFLEAKIRIQEFGLSSLFTLNLSNEWVKHSNIKCSLL